MEGKGEEGGKEGREEEKEKDKQNNGEEKKEGEEERRERKGDKMEGDREKERDRKEERRTREKREAERGKHIHVHTCGLVPETLWLPASLQRLQSVMPWLRAKPLLPAGGIKSWACQFGHR